MSYEIIYDKLFLKVNENEYLPMVLGGSSNCYQFNGSGREIRERSWFTLSTGSNNRLITLNSALKYTQAIRDKYSSKENYKDSEFGYFIGLAIGSANTYKTTFGQFQGLFKTGIKKAITIEQLSNEFNCGVRFHSHQDGDLGVAYTQGELDNLLIEVDSYVKRTNNTVWGFYTHQISKDELMFFRKEHFPRKKREKVLVDKYFCIHISGYGYFRKKTSRSTKMAYLPSSAKKFISEEQAKKYMNSSLKHLDNHVVKIIEINQQAKI